MDFSGTYDLYGVVAPTAMVANYVVFNVPFRTQDYNISINRNHPNTRLFCYILSICYLNRLVNIT